MRVAAMHQDGAVALDGDDIVGALVPAERHRQPQRQVEPGWQPEIMGVEIHLEQAVHLFLHPLARADQVERLLGDADTVSN